MYVKMNTYIRARRHCVVRMFTWFDVVLGYEPIKPSFHNIALATSGYVMYKFSFEVIWKLDNAQV